MTGHASSGSERAGYFADDVAAARHRAAGIACATGKTPSSVALLSRRNARVWEIRRGNRERQVLKLACGRTPVEVSSAAAALAREVDVVRALHGVGLLPYTITDFGTERTSPLTTWTLLPHLPGGRASLMVRNACHGDVDVLDLCARTLRTLARHHHADPHVLEEMPSMERARLDRPCYGRADRAALPVLAELDRLRAAAPQLVLCHGDTSLHNVLVSGQRVVLVDWACARTDLPSLDLAPLFVWLASYTSGEWAVRELLTLARELYRDHPLDPGTGLREHVARVLLQWAAWHGERYRRAAARVAGVSSPEELVTGLFRATCGRTGRAGP